MMAQDRDVATVELALVSHTNAGKTTLARTLLGRDVGEVRDLPHVTDLAEAHTLLELPGGERLQLWDTPGFGNSAKLLQRLRLADNPIGWLLREAWDRWRDRPFWCSQQAVRAARDASDVVLYLVNAAEDPRDAGYLAPEMQVLRWVGKPVIVLLNQVGPPRPPAEEQADLERWRRHLEPFGVVADVLALDAFARCWVHEGVLLESVGRVLPPGKQELLARLGAAWTAQSVARFRDSMALLATPLAAAARDREPLPAGSATALQKLLQTVGVGREQADAARAAAMAAMAARLDRRIVEVTDRLIRLHGLEGSATGAVLERLRTRFASPGKLGEGRAAVWGSVVTGALTGLKADIAAGGLTLGAGLLVGGLIGGLAGVGVARGPQPPQRRRRTRGRLVRRIPRRPGPLGRAALPRGRALRARPRQVGRGRGAGLVAGRSGRGGRAPAAAACRRSGIPSQTRARWRARAVPTSRPHACPDSRRCSPT